MIFVTFDMMIIVKKLRLIVYKPENDKQRKLEIDISYLLNGIELFNQKHYLDIFFDAIVLSHNGIIIPNKKGATIEFSNNWNTKKIVLGYIELSDSLRPNLSIARNSIISIPWILWSNLNYTIRKNIPEECELFIKMYDLNVDFNYKDLNKDSFLMDKKYWASEKIFGKYSLIDILENGFEYDHVFVRYNYHNKGYEILRKKLVELYSKYEISLFKEKEDDKFVLVRKSVFKKNTDLSLNKPNYPPLTFCSYSNFNGLMPKKLDNQIFNIDHPFSKWLIMSYDYLEKNYSNHLYILMNSLDISIINTTLDKLRNHLPEKYKPATDLFLTEEDFKVDFEKIPILKETCL